jgi:dynein heavy chain
MATTGSQSQLHRSNINLYENDLKKKAQAANIAAEKKRGLLDVRHKYLLEKFATYLNEKPSALENSFILGNKLEIVNEFFAENGSKKVLMYWQAPTKEEIKSTGSTAKTLVVTLTAKEMFTGMGCFFVRTTNKSITTANIYQEVSFGPINVGILSSLTSMVKNVILPALNAQENWGVLNRTKDESVRSFMEVLEKFVSDLDVAMVNLHDSVQLNPCNTDLEDYKKPTDYLTASYNPEVVASLEGDTLFLILIRPRNGMV